MEYAIKGFGVKGFAVIFNVNSTAKSLLLFRPIYHLTLPLLAGVANSRLP